MGILVIITLTIPESFWIIICRKSNFNLKYFFCCLFCIFSMFLFVCILLFFLHRFNVFFWFVYLYLVLSLSNVLDSI
jgi:hypothetical protein